MPIKVQNPKTGEIFDIDVDEAMPTDLKGGITPEVATKNSAKAKGYRVLTSIVNPKSGESHDIDEQELDAAIAKGYVIPQVAEAKTPVNQPVSPTEAAGYGFAKFATMGAAPAVGGVVEAIKGGEYEKGRQAYEQRQEQAWNEQPTSYGLGGAAGVIPGMAAKGVSTLGQVALGASAPVIEQATKPITAESAKETATEAVTGGLLGGIGGQLAKTQPGVAQNLGEIAERRAVKAIGADVSNAQRRIERTPGGAQAFGRSLLDTGIVSGGKTVPQMKDKAKELAKASGEVVGNIMANFDKRIGVPAIDSASLLQKLSTVTEKLKKNPSTASLARRLESQWLNDVKAWSEATPRANLAEVWEIRSKLDNVAYNESGIDKAIHKELQGFRNILEDELQRSAKNAGIPEEALKDYRQNKRLYQVAKEAQTTASEKNMRMQKNRSISLSDYISGGAGAAAGATVAGPIGGIAGTVLGAIGNKIARERGPQVAAVTLDKLSGIMKSDPALFQKIVSQFLKTGTVQDIGE
jgi:hypothetical protein